MLGTVIVIVIDTEFSRAFNNIQYKYYNLSQTMTTVNRGPHTKYAQGPPLPPLRHWTVGKAIPKQCVALLKVYYTGQEKIIFFLGAQPGDKNFLQTNGVYFCAQSACA